MLFSRCFKAIYFFPVIFLLSFNNAFCQDIAVVHLKKEKPLLFFQKGVKSDTIIKNKNDVFYLSVPDSLESSISIQVENGRLEPLAKDTLIKLVYLKGLKYESLFLRTEGKRSSEFKTLINGASELENSLIRIRLFDRRSGKVILENLFFYRPG